MTVPPGDEDITAQADSAQDAVIEDGVGLQIILRGVNITDLTAGNFIF